MKSDDDAVALKPESDFSMTTAKENYLKVIFDLISSSQQAHVSRIAERLNVTRASVSCTIKSLQKERLIDHHNS